MKSSTFFVLAALVFGVIAQDTGSSLPIAIKTAPLPDPSSLDLIIQSQTSSAASLPSSIDVSSIPTLTTLVTAIPSFTTIVSSGATFSTAIPSSATVATSIPSIILTTPFPSITFILPTSASAPPTVQPISSVTGPTIPSAVSSVHSQVTFFPAPSAISPSIPPLISSPLHSAITSNLPSASISSNLPPSGISSNLPSTNVPSNNPSESAIMSPTVLVVSSPAISIISFSTNESASSTASASANTSESSSITKSVTHLNPESTSTPPDSEAYINAIGTGGVIGGLVAVVVVLFL